MFQASAPQRTRGAPAVVLALALGGMLTEQAFAAAPARTGEELYRAACAACHGADGRGAPQSVVAFAEPLPDFTDCGFATREPDEDWAAVTHFGGPARGFARMMPAYDAALSGAEIEAILAHMRGFCRNRAWPRGELNLPRPLVTEKAFPEDELVWSADVDGEGDGAFANEIVYEQRLGARGQFEIKVPFGWEERPGTDGAAADGGATDWTGGLGDVTIGGKRALFHSLDRGSILSAGAEVVLPTGDEDQGFGKGTPVFEPFVLFGQILGEAGFLHVHAAVELPEDRDHAENEGILRLALGRSFTPRRFGRSWSPMLEVVGAKELVGGEDPQWDLVPQLQVTLSTRQHVMANLGVRVPASETEGRDTRVLFYLLWDWFDGGLLDGW
jgi:mono/diheme cytochrome c family protein